MKQYPMTLLDLGGESKGCNKTSFSCFAHLMIRGREREWLRSRRGLWERKHMAVGCFSANQNGQHREVGS
jgi:hypothetical protein